MPFGERYKSRGCSCGKGAVGDQNPRVLRGPREGRFGEGAGQGAAARLGSRRSVRPSSQRLVFRSWIPENRVRDSAAEGESLEWPGSSLQRNLSPRGNTRERTDHASHREGLSSWTRVQICSCDLGTGLRRARLVEFGPSIFYPRITRAATSWRSATSCGDDCRLPEPSRLGKCLWASSDRVSKVVGKLLRGHWDR